ncbi:hypothetical protein GCM10023224_05970 [Streptomonospora halophila]|uniref:Uncharacterized protein n=1 Tax=Streptomonospora halophila TaxID=427369 RepID=A0ABP9G5H4_9ACTN
MDAVPSGSCLFITDFADTGEEVQKAIERAGPATLGNGWIRTPEEIRRHFVGYPLVESGWTSIRAGSPRTRTARSPRSGSWSRTCGS